MTEYLVREADVMEGARAVGFTLGMPGVGMVGLVDDILADRAFIEQRQHNAAELCNVADLASPGARTSSPTLSRRPRSPGATASPRPPSATGCGRSAPDGHRIADVAAVDDVRYVDDSKATNPHAAQSSLSAFEPVVWIAGGLAKGASVRRPRQGREGATARRRTARAGPGCDRRRSRATRARCPGDRRSRAARLPSWTVVVRAAADLAQPGDTVLLAPGCASMDMFANYGARGEAFAESVRRLGETPPA